MRLIFEQIRSGGDRNFGYLIGDRIAKSAALVDPSFNPEALIERANSQGLKVEYIINTHGHHDHTNGNARAQELSQAPVATYEHSHIHPDIPLADNSKLPIGSFTLRVLHTPGHCDDHIVLYLEEQDIALTGDHIFVGKVGGSSGRQAAEIEWKSLQRVLNSLPDSCTLWPGHDYGCRPSTSIALEKKTNPFLLAKNFEEFYQLKETWPHFKSIHGLK